MPASRGTETINEDVAPQPPHDRIDRITVALIPRAGQDLQLLQDRTGWSKTDLVNRAITAYEFFDAKSKDGQEILLRDKKTGQTQTVLLL